MNSIRQWIRNVFGFSGNEINGFLILLPLMLVLVFSEPLYRRWLASAERRYQEDTVELDSLVAVFESGRAKQEEHQPAPEASLFTFDPNTAQKKALVQLGFSELLANRIAAYREKGGVFRIKSDLMKIYGLDSALYSQLYKYIRLPTRRFVHTNRGKASSRPVFRPLKEAAERFDINTADTTLLKTVYGIGSTLAARIVKFRDGLGGFVSAEQLNEVYGLDSSVVRRLRKVCFIDPDFVPEKININTADEKELSRHPYIRYDMARSLSSYRYQHGDFTEASDIKKLWNLKPENVERVLPYIKVED